MRRIFPLVVLASLLTALTAPARAQSGEPLPFAQFRTSFQAAAANAPGHIAMEVKDLTTGYSSGVNAASVMPAASTIKIPIMVEVFRQMQLANFDLNRRVAVLPSDKDYGSGSICDSPVGTTYSVSQLLSSMIDVSDNTAANMLIRLVGRSHINQTMTNLGAPHTRLYDSIHTAGWNVRNTLRTSPEDMVSILSQMAKDDLVDEWSSKQMISILEADQINGLIPEPLPQVPIAHKTGSFDDTLNDVGIVYETGSPYVIAVLTTNLPTLSSGRRFIHRVSKIAYAGIRHAAELRDAQGSTTGAAPDAEAAPAAVEDPAASPAGGDAAATPEPSPAP